MVAQAQKVTKATMAPTWNSVGPLISFAYAAGLDTPREPPEGDLHWLADQSMNEDCRLWNAELQFTQT